MVAQYDSQEHALYAKAREADSLQKKQVQVVDKLQEDLEQLKKRNAIKLKVSLSIDTTTEMYHTLCMQLIPTSILQCSPALYLAIDNVHLKFNM